MNITTFKSQVRTIKPNDPRFIIQDGLVISPRAGFEINQHCPYEYRMVITECLRNGWLTPIANMTERELLFVGLSQEI